MQTTFFVLLYLTLLMLQAQVVYRVVLLVRTTLTFSRGLTDVDG